MAVNHATRHRPRRERLLELLADGAWHDWRECSDVAGLRFGARVGELREAGWLIESEDLEVGRRYRLASLEKGPKLGRRVRIYVDESDAEALASGWVSERARLAIKSALAIFRAAAKGAA